MTKPATADMRDPRSTFAIVRREPSEAMLDEFWHATDCDWSSNIRGIGRIAFSAMLAASEPLTDAEIDELCRAMWNEGDAWWWAMKYDNEAPDRISQSPRDEDRARMRAFLATLTGATT